MVYTIIDDLVEQHVLKELQRLKDRNAFLKDLIERGVDDARCATCGKKLESVTAQRMTRPILWHSRECFQWKPKKIVKLERDFGLDIVDVLKETTRRCGKIKAQCAVLGICIPYLYTIIRKYGNMHHVDFFAKYSTGKRRDLYRKKAAKRRAKLAKLKSNKSS